MATKSLARTSRLVGVHKFVPHILVKADVMRIVLLATSVDLLILLSLMAGRAYELYTI